MQGEPDRERIAASLPIPKPEFGSPFIAAHHAARTVVRERTGAKVGWSIANGALTPTPGNEEKFRQVQHDYEDMYLEACARRRLRRRAVRNHRRLWTRTGLSRIRRHPDNTLVGTAYRPDALAMAVGHTAKVTGGSRYSSPRTASPPLMTPAGSRSRVRRCTHLGQTMADGVDVRGYLHWSLLDNYEWGHWGPTFGLVGVNRSTFARTPKPSLAWLGQVARDAGSFLTTP